MTMQYFYRDDNCPAAHASEPSCICWHDRGTGPFSNGYPASYANNPKYWRKKPEPKVEPMTIQFTKIAPGIIPKVQTEGSAGFDLHALESGVIYPGEWQKIRTGIAVAIPAGHVGLIKPRSSLAVKHGLDVLAGVIDSDYRGEIIVVLINHSRTMYNYCAEGRIAQLIVTPIMVDYRVVPSLDNTARGIGGFGSTGV